MSVSGGEAALISGQTENYTQDTQERRDSFCRALGVTAPPFERFAHISVRARSRPSAALLHQAFLNMCDAHYSSEREREKALTVPVRWSVTAVSFVARRLRSRPRSRD